MLQPLVYLTCEIKERDFKPRLLIAGHLLKRGYSVIVGQQWSLFENAERGPKGCYLFKTSNRFQVEAMRNVRAAGHVVVASDEEALSTAAALAAHTTDPNTFDYCATFLALNEDHKRALCAAYPHAASKVVVAGTARADLLRAATPPPPHPRSYILVNTSFGLLNSIWGNVETATRVWIEGMGWDDKNSDHAKVVESRLAYERAALQETLTLVQWLAANSDTDVVVRPHPSEEPALWQKTSGTHVVTESDPTPWLQHASIMIHNDSTIGVEAAIMGVPSLNLSPHDAWATRVNLRAVNDTVRSAQEAISYIKNGRTAQRLPETIAPVDGADATAREITKLLPAPGPVRFEKWGTYFRTELQKAKIAVAPDECLSALKEILPLTGARPRGISQLDDSVFLLEAITP